MCRMLLGVFYKGMSGCGEGILEECVSLFVCRVSGGSVFLCLSVCVCVSVCTVAVWSVLMDLSGETALLGRDSPASL